MQVDEALGQIAEIHDHLARGEEYRGFHPVAVAASGLIGLVAAAAQSSVLFFVSNWLSGPTYAEFAAYWLVVAAFAGAVGVAPAVSNYFYHEDEFARRRTRRIAGQFLPCVVAGLCITVVAIRLEWHVVTILPGIWMLLFSLGIFATRPYLPRAIGWIGLFYLLAGVGLLAQPTTDVQTAGWAVGSVFAIGQFATTAVLTRNLERLDV
jgi:hypothetical protein